MVFFYNTLGLSLLIPMSDQDRIPPYNINQTSDENGGKYQFGDNWLIQY